MSRFFWVNEDRASAEKHGGEVDGWRPLALPGVNCHTCGATWSDVGHDYPSVDLTQLPERRELERARPEPFPEFARLREAVRPLTPPQAQLPPGTGFGPLVGRAWGEFGPIAWAGGLTILMRRDGLEHLQAEGVRGLKGFRTELRFRQKPPPDLLELELEPRGRLHPDCIPPDVPPPCPICGRHGFMRPEAPILEAASLPQEVDLFRVGDFATMVIATERCREAVRSLGLDGFTFQELPTR
ncbi:hypothetical protein MYSTI_07677 [Myxococcus stipitatus DSM 14675]|uniref:Uncharacterized protein n=1 Tax=Myxococcus stipitatus (strain DSM 14675 / JCM 12634 / Mx s8) TaxID=1278073 RepID=L7UQX8_MYXSD|nr:double-CXXCG motif protein [Myxococcus stipitatus]AGC48949.1 hypothetical protein MYSTI_07677 [Myxococcus stipitatus DSM 14675]